MRSQMDTYPFLQVFEDLDLDESLVVETFLVPDDLDSDGLPSRMITTLENLAE